MRNESSKPFLSAGIACGLVSPGISTRATKRFKGGRERGFLGARLKLGLHNQTTGTICMDVYCRGYLKSIVGRQAPPPRPPLGDTSVWRCGQRWAPVGSRRGRPQGRQGRRRGRGRGGRLTGVLAKLVHGLQVDDVGRETAVHLAQHHAAPGAGAGANHRLDVVAHGRAVGTPAAVLVQPFPDHHGRGQEHGEPGAAAAAAAALRCLPPGPGAPALLRFLLRRRLRASTAPPALRPDTPGSLSSGPWAAPQPRIHRGPETRAAGLRPRAAAAAARVRRCCRCSVGSSRFMQMSGSLQTGPRLAKPPGGRAAGAPAAASWG